MSESIVLNMKEVRKSFSVDGNALEVLKGVSFSVKAGEQVAVVGPSGSGKSTLLHVAGTLLRPTSGEVFLRGRKVEGQSDSEISRWRNQEVGFVFQFHHLQPDLTALENVLVPMKISGRWPGPEQTRRAKEFLGQVGLADRLAHRPGEMSGGEQQRVAVARALVLEPALILADEPTGNLDRANGERIFHLLGDLCRRREAALVMVTHHEEAGRRCERMITMADGRIET